MPLLRISPVLLSALCALGSLGFAYPAAATLGETETTVQGNVATLNASIKSSQDLSTYKVHELALPSGTLVREYVNASGMVFAVSWSGPYMPNLQELLGQYFATLQTAPKAAHADRRHLQVELNGLLVQNSGHMRAFRGRAYLPAAIPGGMSVGEIQ